MFHVCFLLDEDIFEYNYYTNSSVITVMGFHNFWNVVNDYNNTQWSYYTYDWNYLGNEYSGSTTISPDELHRAIVNSGKFPTEENYDPECRKKTGNKNCTQYDFLNNNCQDFVQLALNIVGHKNTEKFITYKNNSYQYIDDYISNHTGISEYKDFKVFYDWLSKICRCNEKITISNENQNIEYDTDFKINESCLFYEDDSIYLDNDENKLTTEIPDEDKLLSNEDKNSAKSFKFGKYK